MMLDFPDLTRVQYMTLKFIHDTIQEMGYSPSYKDIAIHFKKSPNTIPSTIKCLRKKGLLAPDPMNFHSRKPTEKAIAWLERYKNGNQQ